MTELLDVAARVVAMAGDGEQVEAFVARRRSTTVRAYEGEVESLTQAASAGIGVRVVGRSPRRASPTPERSTRPQSLEVLAEARDNAAFAEPDEHNGLATPDGVEPVDLDLWPEALDGHPLEAKIDARPRPRTRDRGPATRASPACARPSGATASARPRWRPAPASGVWSRAGDAATCRCRRWPPTTATRRSATGSRSAASRPSSTSTRRRPTRSLARDPPAGCPQAGHQPGVARARPCMTAPFLGIVGGMLNGSAVLKGRSLVRRPRRRGGRLAIAHLRRRPDRCPLATVPTATTARDSPAAATSWWLEGVLQGFLHNSYTGRRSGTASTGLGGAGLRRRTPGVGAQALPSHRAPAPTTSSSPPSTTACT